MRHAMILIWNVSPNGPRMKALFTTCVLQGGGRNFKDRKVLEIRGMSLEIMGPWSLPLLFGGWE